MSVPINANFNDFENTAKTIFGEARGESYLGKIAVAWVIRNRAVAAKKYLVANPTKGRHPQYGSGTMQSAALAAMQFSCWNPDDPNYALIRGAGLQDMWHKHESFADCMLAACAVICGRHEDPTSGSLHYFDPRAANPSWAKGMTPVCTIGHHQFYNNIR